MEALPFLPFVQIPPKLTETNVTPSLSGAIRVAIAQTGRNPDEHLGGLREFETLRNAMIVAIGDSAIHKSFLAGPSYYDVYGDALRQYAVQATSIFKRFNSIYIDGNSWQTANQKRNTVKSDAMAFEMASALWNHSHYLTIHALHELSLENDENIKQAATNFQQAAGCLTYILGKCHDLPGKDLSPANIKFMILLMLQQAHEVIVIKALRDSKLQKTAAKLAWTCADYCEQLEALLPEEAGYKSSEIKFLKTWIVFKMEFFQAITHFCQGMDAEERKEYGQAVTYFRQARQCLGNSQKQAAKLDSDNDLAAALGYADDVINGKCTSAENDNEFIYHMAVKESLPPPGTISKPIVNAVPWEPDDREYFGDVISEDIFISNSNYSDRLDQLWRDISKEIDDKNNELQSCKEALVIAGIDLESEKTDRSVLPETLIQAAAQAEKMQKNCSKLTTCLQSIGKYENQVDEKIAAAEKKFVADEEMLKSCPPGDSRAKFDKDPAWLALHARIMKIKKAAEQSKGPTLTCKDAASLMAEKLELLGKGLEAVREELPTVVISDDDAEAIGMVSMLLSKIREMENQREEQKKLLKDELDADNITGKLAGEPEHLHSKIFDTEIAKHDIRIGYLRQNLSAQGNILAVLDDARVNYAGIPNAEIYRRKRDSTQLYDEKCSQLINAIINYDKIYEKLIGGQKLLEKILGELAKLEAPLESAAMQRSQALQKLTAPKRPEKPKPIGNGTANLPKEMLEELKALGLEDDQEFIEFLKSSGELKNAAISSQPPANIPKLPGISPKKVANAMRGGAPSGQNFKQPNYQTPIRPVKATPPATQFNRPLPPDTTNVQSYNSAPSVSGPSDLPPKMNFETTVRPTNINDTYNFPASTQQTPHVIPPNASSETATDRVKEEKIIPDQGTNSNEIGPSNADQIQPQGEISKFNHQQHLQQQQMFNFQQQELQKQQWMMQQQFQAQMQQQQQQIAMKRREEEAKLAHERRTMMEQMKRMEEERSKLEDDRLKFEKERKNRQDQEKARVQYVASMPQMPPTSSFQSRPTGEQWLLQYRNYQQQQVTGVPPRNPAQNLVQGRIQHPVAPSGPNFVPASRPNLSSSPASIPAPTARTSQPYRMPIMTNVPHPMIPQMSHQPVPRPNNPVQSSQNNHSVIRQPNQPPLLRPTITSKPINSIVPVPQNNPIATSEMKSTQANRIESNFDLLSNLSEFTPSPTEKPTTTQNAQTAPASTSFETTNLLNKISTLSASRVTPRLAKVPDQAIHLITNTIYPPDQFRIMSKTIAAARCSTQHNRQQQLVPYDENRVILRGPGNDYINASRVSTMCTSIPFAIVSETPLPPSQDDLWRMAWQENIEILVMIASPEEAADDSIMSWHPRGSNRQFPRAGIIVESRVTEKSDFVSVYNVTLSKQNIKRTISVYEITQWAAQLTPNIEALGAVTAKIATRFINQRSKDIPITFMSSNGDARCGTLLFILVLLIAPDFHPLSLYKTLQESRCSLLMSRISIPALDIFKSINSHIS